MSCQDLMKKFFINQVIAIKNPYQETYSFNLMLTRSILVQYKRKIIHKINQIDLNTYCNILVDKV
jgi:hypothetical protein